MGWIIYFDATYPDEAQRGLIDQIYEGSETAAIELAGDRALMEGSADPQTQYIDLSTGQVANKLNLALTLDKDTISADGVDEAVLSGLPIPFTVSVNGQPVLVDDGSLEISTAAPGVFSILCSHAAYFEERHTVYAI